MATVHAEPSELGPLIEAGLKAQRAGDQRLAEECYERVLALAPGNFDGLQLLGLLRVQAGERSAGIELLERAVAVDPRQICALNNLGNALLNTGRVRDAVDAYRRALVIDPMSVPVLTNLALTLLQVGEYRFASRCIDRALQTDPRNPELMFALGHLLHGTRRPKDAAQAYRNALELGLAGPGIRLSLGLALAELGDDVGALEQFLAAENLTPTQTLRMFRAYAALQCCHWERFHEDTLALENEGLRAGESPVDPMRTVLLPLSGPRLRQYAERHATDLAAIAQALPKARWIPPPPSAAGGRLRIAYVSPDFRDHAVGRLIGPVLAGHDRRSFEVLAYGWGPPGRSGERERIAASCDRLHVVDGLTDEALVARLRADRIDIAIDLAGYTAHNRSAVFAPRIAPVQVSWLGYPGTTGGRFMDYLVADEFIIPSGNESHFTEQIVRLPHTYLPYDPTRSIGTPLSRAEYGLPENAVVLACLGQVRKINPLVFDAWMAVLRQVPEAVLWLASTYAPAIENLRRAAETRSVDRERLVFAAPVASHADHLARYRAIDIALDTFPYGSHTTAADALWAGCPLIAVVGETFASRVSGSILQAAGLPELVTDNLERYRALLLDLTRDPVWRRTLRSRVAAQRSGCPLFDTSGFVRFLELAYLEMWGRYRRGEPPAAIRVHGVSTVTA